MTPYQFAYSLTSCDWLLSTGDECLGSDGQTCSADASVSLALQNENRNCTVTIDNVEERHHGVWKVLYSAASNG